MQVLKTPILRGILYCMDAIEHVIATILEREGGWVRITFKVELTKEEKIANDRPSCPRWELDVIGYRPGDNLLQVVTFPEWSA